MTSTISSESSNSQPGGQVARVLKKLVPVTARYLLYLPEGYGKSRRDRWPLVLFLHGAGERGSDIEKVKVHGPPRLVAEGKQFPFILVSPQCGQGKRWSPLVLDTLLQDVCKRYRVDPARVYVTGISMGGYGTWMLAAEFPDRFAAIVPICGGGQPRAARLMRNLPVWVFHGAKDTAVPLQQSQEMVDALKAVGGNVRFTIYPEAGHDSWTETYNNPEVYEWLLAQRRTTLSESP